LPERPYVRISDHGSSTRRFDDGDGEDDDDDGDVVDNDAEDDDNLIATLSKCEMLHVRRQQC
jgi:hypothetical protein